MKGITFIYDSQTNSVHLTNSYHLLTNGNMNVYRFQFLYHLHPVRVKHIKHLWWRFKSLAGHKVAKRLITYSSCIELAKQAESFNFVLLLHLS